VAGSLLVTAVGHHPDWSIVVILAALFFGLYLNRISYAVTVLGITVTVAQLYEQLGEFSNSLLLLRLEETALGAAIAVAVVNLVLPLRTRRVLRIAFRDLVRAAGRLASHASDHLRGEDHDIGSTLRSDARAVDAAYQALMAAAQPVRRTLPGRPDEDISQALQLARQPGTTAATWSPTPNGPGRPTPARAGTSNWPARPSSTHWTRSPALSPGERTGPTPGHQRSSTRLSGASRSAPPSVARPSSPSVTSSSSTAPSPR
jgi:hypothetical protein